MNTISQEAWDRLTPFQQEAISELVKAYIKQNDKQVENEVITFYLIECKGELKCQK